MLHFLFENSVLNKPKIELSTEKVLVTEQSRILWNVVNHQKNKKERERDSKESYKFNSFNRTEEICSNFIQWTPNKASLRV